MERQAETITETMTTSEILDFNNDILNLSMNHPGLISYLNDLNSKLNPLGIKVLKIEPKYEVIEE